MSGLQGYRILGLGTVLVLSGCSLVPEYARPEMSFGNMWGSPLPAPALSSEEKLAQSWWTQLGSSELNMLVSRALAQNNDLVAASERIAQARGSLRVAGASLLPSVSGGASASNGSANGGSDWNSNENLNATASYELDLFGANRANRKAAEAQLEAAGYDRDALALTTASDVAQTYINLMAMRERITLAEENLTASRRILDLLETRLRVGASGLLDVTQQRTATAQAEANIASLRQQQTAYMTALATLTGTAPQDFAVSGTSLARLTPLTVPVSAPATLLERRPDLKMAEANLKAADADIGAARAAFFPTTTLSAGLVQNLNPTATALDLGASLLAPIFTGGANSGNLQVATARQREVAANYRQAVLTAFGETADAIASLQSAQAQLASQTTAAENADTALRLSRLQLEAGSIDLPTLLNTQASQLAAQDARAQAQADTLTASVQLARVMGGGF